MNFLVRKVYLHYHIFHVIKLLRVKKGSELLTCGNTITISVSCLEAPFIPGEHGLIGGLVLNVIKLLI